MLTKLDKVFSVKRGKSLKGEFYSHSGKTIRLTLANFYEKGGFKPSNTDRNIYYIGPLTEGQVLSKNTLITPLTEQTPGLLGSMAFIPENDKYIACGDIGVITVKDKDKYSKRYINYLFAYDFIRKQLVRGAQKSKIRHISDKDFYQIEWDFPPIEEQRKIGRLLKAIDEKISVNQQINDKLTNVIELCFNYYLSNSDITSSPKLKDLNLGIITGKTPKTSIKEYYGDDICFVKPADIRKGAVLIDSEQRISHLGAESQRNKTIPKGSICVSTIASFGNICITGTDSVQTNQQIQSLVFQEIDDKRRYWLYCALKHVLKLIVPKSSTFFVNMNKSEFSEIEVPFIDMNKVEEFNDFVKPIFEQLENIALENKLLEQRKNDLIKLLYSGKVSLI